MYWELGRTLGHLLQAKTNSTVDTDDDSSDHLSRVSWLSQQSLVDFLEKNDSDKIDGSYHPSVLLPESDSEHF